MPALHAQTQSNVPSADDQAVRRECEAKVIDSGAVAPFKAPSNIRDGTRAALACEWKDPNGLGQVLKAMQLRAMGSDLNVVAELEAGDPYPADNDLYSAAMRDPDISKDLLATLAKANTVTAEEKKRESTNTNG